LHYELIVYEFQEILRHIYISADDNFYSLLFSLSGSISQKNLN